MQTDPEDDHHAGGRDHPQPVSADSPEPEHSGGHSHHHGWDRGMEADGAGTTGAPGCPPEDGDRHDGIYADHRENEPPSVHVPMIGPLSSPRGAGNEPDMAEWVADLGGLDGHVRIGWRTDLGGSCGHGAIE